MTQHILTVSNYLQNPIENLIDIFKSLKAALDRRANINQTIKELNKLSDRELNDIGMSRGDIWWVANEQYFDNQDKVESNRNLKGWV